MLELHFINVADGDAILAEERREDRAFRLLVDTGRPEPSVAPGSVCCTAAEYLRGRGISHLDALVITHLHIDHFGGLRQILESVSVSDVYASFIPEGPCALDRELLSDQKTVRGLAGCLEIWARDCERLRETGCRMHTVSQTESVRFTDRLGGQIVCPDPSAAAYQRQAYGDMLAGREVPEGLQYWSAKYRNPGSLRVRLTYAGREIELSGDCYGAAWEDQAQPCDIFKAPHHADAKAITETLAQRLRPRYAVVSCAAEYNPKKDRPSRAAVELLERQGAKVWFTDSFAADWREPVYWRSVDFIIEEEGDVLPPRRQI